MKTILLAFASGSLFSIGLGISGMTQPMNIIGFLDVTGEWNPTLVFVLASSVGVYFLVSQFVLKRKAPILASAFAIPPKGKLDARLIGGAMLFGVGWGISGYCPGPALTSIPSGAPYVLVFVGSMIAGMLLFQWVQPVFAKSAPGQREEAFAAVDS